MTDGHPLKIMRAKFELTIVDLSKIINAQPATISNWENNKGEGAVNMHHMYKLEKYLIDERNQSGYARIVIDNLCRDWIDHKAKRENKEA